MAAAHSTFRALIATSAAVSAALACAGSAVAAPGPARGVVKVKHCTDAALRQAVADVPSGGTVRFACDGTITIDPAQGPIQIPADESTPQDVTLDGAGHGVTISGGDQTDMFFVTGGGTVTLRHLALTHGRLGQDAQHGFRAFGGAAVAATNTKLVLDHVNFSHNQAFGSDNGGAGGAVDVFGPHGALVVTDSRFADNAVECDTTCLDGGGGAIAFRGGGAARIARSTFRDNTSLGGDGGGAVAGTFPLFGGKLTDIGPITITGSDFEDNADTALDLSDRPGRGGGAIVSFNHPLSVAHTRFAGNTAHALDGLGPAQGGAIRVADTDTRPNPSMPPAPPVSITDSSFQNNGAEGQDGASSGGAVSVDLEPLRILRSTFAHNQAPFGGALDTFGTTTITDSTLAANTAGGSPNGTGGAIWTAGQATFKRTTVAQNTPDGCYRYMTGQIVDGGQNRERPGTSCGFEQKRPAPPHRHPGLGIGQAARSAQAARGAAK